MKILSEKYVQALINCFPCGKIVANWVMAVARYTSAKSIIEYSESPVFHYEHSSIGKLFERLLESLDGKPERFALQVQEFTRFYRPAVSVMRTQLDTTPVFKPHSVTHPDRMAVHRPNETIYGNKPVEIGYPLSCLNPGLDSNSKWSIPVLMERVATSETGVPVGIRQLQTLLNQIVAVVSLPQTTFTHTGAGVKSSVLFLKKHTQAMTDSIKTMQDDLKQAILNEKKVAKTFQQWETDKKNALKPLAKAKDDAAQVQKDAINEAFAEKWNALQEELAETFQQRKQAVLPNYPILMAMAEHIGYDATGKPTQLNDLPEISETIERFITNLEKGMLANFQFPPL